MKDPELKIYELPVADLVPYARNAKEHSAAQVDTIAASIEEFGNCDPIAVWHNDKGEPEIVEGHGRLLALKKLGHEYAPVIYLDHLSDEQRRAYTHVHNQTTLNSGFDVELLDDDIEQLDFDWASFGFDIVANAGDSLAQDGDGRRSASLADRFGVAPFSVLNARAGEWQQRKHAWLDMGIESERGRGGAGIQTRNAGCGAAIPSGSPLPLNRGKKWG